MEMIDSLTKQIIVENEDVLLVVMVNSRSENNSVSLLTRQDEQYLLASLPIAAYWTGYGFDVRSETQFAVQTFLTSFGFQDGTFSEAIESIWDKGSKISEKAPWNCSNMKEYSIFAIKNSTLDKLGATTVVRESIPFDPEQERVHRTLALAFVGHYVTAVKAMENVRSLDLESQNECFDNLEKYARMISLRCDSGYAKDYVGYGIPYASNALQMSSESFFANKLIRTLNKNTFIDEGGEFETRKYREFYSQVHLACALHHAMSCLDLPFAPTYCAQSQYREKSKMEFLTSVLAEELEKYCDEASAYNDNPEQDIENLLAPLKGVVGRIEGI